MDLGLKGKTAVVSGSTAGIGFAIAAALAVEGASVVVNGRTEARVVGAVEGVRRQAKDAQVTGIAADLAAEDVDFEEAQPIRVRDFEEWLRLENAQIVDHDVRFRSFLEEGLDAAECASRAITFPECSVRTGDASSSSPASPGYIFRPRWFTTG